MPTGACGINCDVCKLKIVGICSSCGPGNSPEAARKIEAQMRLLGQPCPILACAQTNNIRYCMCDCRSFPCENFTVSLYPYSRGFLSMQERRRTHQPPARTPVGDAIKVPADYWDDLKMKDIDKLCSLSLAKPDRPRGAVLPFLNQEILVDMQKGCIRRFNNQSWEKIDYPLLEMVVLVYLLNVTDVPLAHEKISVRDLKDAQFFQGPHMLKTGPLLELYGKNVADFKRAAKELGGMKLDMADAAFKFQPLPRIPLYYLLWKGDEEFAPNLSILFDRSIERHLSADAIWGLVNLVSDMLLLS